MVDEWFDEESRCLTVGSLIRLGELTTRGTDRTGWCKARITERNWAGGVGSENVLRITERQVKTGLGVGVSIARMRSTHLPFVRIGCGYAGKW
jgi:hypothetical protein